VPAPEPADWDVVDTEYSDPEDIADADGVEADLDDLPDDLPEDAGQDLVPPNVEEAVPWQDYNRPIPD
jgi:hypothetical protein